MAENLIPEFERVVAEAQPRWFLMENVERAPLPEVRGFMVQDEIVSDFRVGGQTTRLRRFCFGFNMGDWHESLDRGTVPLPRFEVAQDALWTPNPEPTVCASGGDVGRPPTERHKATRKGASAMGYKTHAYLAKALRLQGLPEDFLDAAPFTVAGKIKVVGNGVPLPMGRAVAKAVVAATDSRGQGSRPGEGR